MACAAALPGVPCLCLCAASISILTRWELRLQQWGDEEREGGCPLRVRGRALTPMLCIALALLWWPSTVACTAAAVVGCALELPPVALPAASAPLLLAAAGLVAGRHGAIASAALLASVAGGVCTALLSHSRIRSAGLRWRKVCALVSRHSGALLAQAAGDASGDEGHAQLSSALRRVVQGAGKMTVEGGEEDTEEEEETPLQVAWGSSAGEPLGSGSDAGEPRVSPPPTPTSQKPSSAGPLASSSSHSSTSPSGAGALPSGAADSQHAGAATLPAVTLPRRTATLLSALVGHAWTLPPPPLDPRRGALASCVKVSLAWGASLLILGLAERALQWRILPDLAGILPTHVLPWLASAHVALSAAHLGALAALAVEATEISW